MPRSKRLARYQSIVGDVERRIACARVRTVGEVERTVGDVEGGAEAGEGG